MAFQSLAQTGAPSVFQTLVNEKHVSQPLFSVYLAEQGSELTIGEVDSTKYIGERLSKKPFTSRATRTHYLKGSLSTFNVLEPLVRLQFQLSSGNVIN